ncbi:TetR/AcrR family transcriptional regulator [Halobacillus campisalis]|uniref:TetR/AcrR family transcriptional regulator n=1 Tax=Halobacillus campisalis TaxID=435909 RepID=A0ABW2K5W5_9BACI|nr:TetR/AcrR family transcriptional regulator [Halobacillus campisalis]
MEERNDPRVLRSQKWIKEAFLKLLSEKHLDDITVQDIMNEAQMNRATFYRHFHDKEMLLEVISDELLENWRKRMESCDPHYDFVSAKLPHPRFVTLLEFIHQEKKVFSTLLYKQNLPAFRLKFDHFIKKSTHTTLSIAFAYNHTVKFSRDITQTFIASSITGTILWWIEENFPWTSYELAAYVTEMIDYGIFD